MPSIVGFRLYVVNKEGLRLIGKAVLRPVPKTLGCLRLSGLRE